MADENEVKPLIDLLPADAMKKYLEAPSVNNLEKIALSAVNFQKKALPAKIFEFETPANKFYETFKSKFNDKIKDKDGNLNYELKIKDINVQDDMKKMILDYAKEQLGNDVVEHLKTECGHAEGSDDFNKAVLARFSLMHGKNKKGGFNIDYSNLFESGDTKVGGVYSALNGSYRANFLANEYVRNELDVINPAQIDPLHADKLHAQLIKAAGHDIHELFHYFTHNERVNSLPVLLSGDYKKEKAHELGIKWKNDSMLDQLKAYRTSKEAEE